MHWYSWNPFCLKMRFCIRRNSLPCLISTSNLKTGIKKQRDSTVSQFLCLGLFWTLNCSKETLQGCFNFFHVSTWCLLLMSALKSVISIISYRDIFKLKSAWRCFKLEVRRHMDLMIELVRNQLHELSLWLTWAAFFLLYCLYGTRAI